MSAVPLPGAAAGPAAPDTERLVRLVWALLILGAAIALGTAFTRYQANPILMAMTAALVVAAWQRYLLAWPVLVGYLAVVILFIPIRRYTLGAGLPFELEPYRFMIALVLLAWFGALLVDVNTRWRRTGLEGPLVAFALAAIASLTLNIGTVTSTEITSEVLGKVSFFVSFFLVMYFISGVITTRRQLEVIVGLVVGGGAILGLLSIVEWKTGTNLFNNLGRVFPPLHLHENAVLGAAEDSYIRGFRVRAYGSAEHPIALGAALVMLLPLAIYLYRRTQKWVWLVAAGALTLGALGTSSRTAALMLLVELAVFLWLKRRETMRLLPLLLPLFVAVQVVMPGTLGTFRAILFPEGGIVNEQRGGEGAGTGRIADLAPSLSEWAQQPFFGQGFGTRLTSDVDKFVNARILDNQWLSTLLETGALGALALVWLYVRAVRMLARRARQDRGSHGWLFTALAASTAAYAIGQLSFDSFSFIQVTFISFMLLGLAAAALRLPPTPAHWRVRGQVE